MLMADYSRLLAVFGVFLLLALGCTAPNSQEIKTHEAAVASGMNSASALLDFQEQGALASFEPRYQADSDKIRAACEKLGTLDKDWRYSSNETKAVCGSRKELDKCFFQLERIKTQLKNNDTDINLDSLDVLCSDLRSVGLQGRLDGFKSQYKKYAGWLDAERGILAEWGTISALFSNTTSSSQLKSAKMTDYYTEFKGQMARVEASLQKIKDKCWLRNDFKADGSRTEAICDNVDDYLADVTKIDAIALDTFDFFGKFEVGTTTVDRTFIAECKQANLDFARIYELKLTKDTKAEGSNETDFAFLCDGLENLSIIYGQMGIPLIFENGELSPTTRTELFKAKTVYVETDGGLGSGVILSSGTSGYYILTNAHVALDYDPYTGSKSLPSRVRVKFSNGKVGYATELGYTQEDYDLVLLYVPSSGTYPTASYYGDSYPNAGDKVVAVGNPYGLQFSVTQGTVSGIRDMGCLSDYCYGTVIQTDTAINPGNSGGGLWDYNGGDLVGINSLALTQAEGLNFAISMYQYEQIKDTFKWYDI